MVCKSETLSVAPAFAGVLAVKQPEKAIKRRAEGVPVPLRKFSVIFIFTYRTILDWGGIPCN